MNFVARNLNKLQKLSLEVESSFIYMKLGSLFVLFYNYEIHQIKAFQIVLLVFLESS
jgi:hypothetical protein